LSFVRPKPNAKLARITATDNGTNWRDQNREPGPFSMIAVFFGTAQLRNQGYIAYAQTIAITVPSTPPNPSSRSGLAGAINRLPKPSDAQIIDQKDAGNVMRRASDPRSRDFFPARPARVCQLNVMYTRCDIATTNTIVPRFA